MSQHDPTKWTPQTILLAETKRDAAVEVYPDMDSVALGIIYAEYHSETYLTPAEAREIAAALIAAADAAERGPG